MSTRALALVALSSCSFVIELPELPFCGDGMVGPNEECDDGNTLFGDGCDPSCVAAREQLFNSTIEGGQADPSIAFYSSGAWLLVFDDESAAPPDIDGDGAVRARHFDENGATTGADFVVHQNVRDKQEHGCVAANESALIVWDDASSGSRDVHGRAFSQGGGATAPDFLLTERHDGEQRYPVVAVGASGFLAVWIDETTHEIRGRKIDLGGTPVGPELAIGGLTASSVLPPAVATDGDRFLVTWAESSDDTVESDIRARFIGWDGTMTDVFTVNSTILGAQTEPALAFDRTSRRFLAVWTDESGSHDTLSTGIRGRMLSTDHDFLGEDFGLNDVIDGPQEEATVTSTQGVFFVAWTGVDEVEASSAGIRGRRVSSDGTLLDAEAVINTITQEAQNDATVAAGPGGFYVLWEDESETSPDLSEDAIRGLILPVR